MPADVAAAARLVADIADQLGTTPDAIRDPGYLDAMRRHRTDLFAGVLATDPDFSRIAQAYLGLQEETGRRAIADAVVSIAGAFALRTALRGEG